MPHRHSLRYEARQSDTDQIVRIVEATGVFNKAEVAIAVELIEDRLAKGARSDYSFIFADQGETLSAYTCYGLIPATDERYEVYWIAVDKPMQRSGLGGRIMKATEDEIRRIGGKRIYVETSSTSQYAPTREFYSRLGYTLTAQLAGYHTNDDDLCFFVKDLA